MLFPYTARVNSGTGYVSMCVCVCVFVCLRLNIKAMLGTVTLRKLSVM